MNYPADELRDAIMECRRTTRAANAEGLSAAERAAAYEADDAALERALALVAALARD